MKGYGAGSIELIAPLIFPAPIIIKMLDHHKRVSVECIKDHDAGCEFHPKGSMRTMYESRAVELVKKFPEYWKLLDRKALYTVPENKMITDYDNK